MLLNEVSVFIMDVSNSSNNDIGNELSSYLQQLQTSITKWTENITITKVSHRAGDELVVVSSGYASAYILAFYISRIWKFVDHQPYFGLSFGNINQDITTLNLETWIHPLMKQARNANDYLKKQQNRSLFHMALPNVSDKHGWNTFSKQFETLINTSFRLKQEHINDQTNIQSLVCSLYLIFGQQSEISQYLERTKGTISHHMKQGKTQVILQAFHNIVELLDSLEVSAEYQLTDMLQKNIRYHVMNHLQDYFPKGGRIS
ncbi:hypothetical protein SH601_09370 [Gracilibacillus sp. S3-1-1]|uniref:Uncharacterized protein n=1 Tax=Gracilibacillus pellucidus TaxID=3095368 RepID=A0ACC6M5H2_9BACI|nr:hypothetical protein [Gracilibacillus sp. S3-1-1]MDX8046199.1 hypothetical protein [Gracilibacillus sp. S3-1-1]